VKRHGCPSHGVGLTPDEKELWLSDGANSKLHVFDATVMPPKQVATISVRDQPGWITFSLDGRYAFPSTGEIIDTKTETAGTPPVEIIRFSIKATFQQPGEAKPTPPTKAGG